MSAREHDHDPYWQHDLAIGEGLIHGQPTTIRLLLHAAAEDYRGRDELLPRSFQTGPRTYLQARPYILEPEITLTIGLYPQPSPQGKAGEVLASEWEGMRHREIGQAQAWCYPATGTAVLWECYLFDTLRQDSPVEDVTLTTLWTGFEGVLSDHSPALERIVTPSWEDIYEHADWQEFLRLQGYCSFTNRAFIKEMDSS